MYSCSSYGWAALGDRNTGDATPHYRRVYICVFWPEAHPTQWEDLVSLPDPLVLISVQ